MKRILFLALFLILGVLLFVFAFQQVGPQEIQEALFLFPKEGLAVAIAVNFLAVFLIGSYRWQLVLKAQNCPISFWKVMRAKMAGFTLSYITPAALVGGEPVRAYMVKEESKCGWEKSFASVIIDQTVFFASLFFAMILGFLFLADHFSLPAEVFYAFGIIFIGSASLFYLFYRKLVNRSAGEQAFFTFIIHKTRLDRLGFVKKKLHNVDAAEKIMEKFFREEKKYVLAVVLLALFEAFLDILVISIICFYLGQDVGFSKSLGVFFFLTLANFFPIPGSLGSFEMALTFVFGLLGIGKEIGLAFSLISRLINIIFCVAGGFALAYFSIKTVSNSFSLEAPPVLVKVHKAFAKLLRKAK